VAPAEARERAVVASYAEPNVARHGTPTHGISRTNPSCSIRRLLR